MFRRLSEPLPLSEASLLALRPAMNAPVLNVGFLPVGPARAAIVAFAEEWGGIGLALGIRSNEGGQVAVFRNQESIDFDVSITAALEPALAEAERLGFLFDEDMVEGAPDGSGRLQAMALWGRLMGDIEMPPAPRAAPSEPAATDPKLEPLRDLPNPGGPSLAPSEHSVSEPPVLDEELPLELELDALADGPDEVAAPASSAALDEIPLDVPAPAKLPPAAKRSRRTVGADQSEVTMPMAPPPARTKKTRSGEASRSDSTPLATATPPAQQLSKFRNAEAASVDLPGAEAGDVTGGGSELGRIPLVRVRKERGSGSKLPILARLLSSF